MFKIVHIERLLAQDKKDIAINHISNQILSYIRGCPTQTFDLPELMLHFDAPDSYTELFYIAIAQLYKKNHIMLNAKRTKLQYHP